MCRILLHIYLTAKRPKDLDYPKSLITIGDHLRKVRLDRGIGQKEVAKILRTSDRNVWRWENIERLPSPPIMSRILTFIGYVPIDFNNATSGEKLYWARLISGLTQEQTATRIKVSPQTIMFFETNKKEIKSHIVKQKIYSFIKSQFANFAQKLR